MPQLAPMSWTLFIIVIWMQISLLVTANTWHSKWSFKYASKSSMPYPERQWKW